MAPPAYTGVDTARGYFQQDPDLRRIFDNLHWIRNYMFTNGGNTNCTFPKQRMDPVAEQTARQSVPLDRNIPGTFNHQEEIREAHHRGLALGVADMRTQLLNSYFFLVYVITFLLFITYI